MKTLIIGGKKGNIGGFIGNNLFGETKTVCRNSQESLDIGDRRQVAEIIKRYRPDNIIVAAGFYPKTEKLGSIKDWKGVYECLQTKIIGALNVINFAVKYKVKKLIIIGGSEISSDPKFCHFTIANGALWSAVNFAAKHTKTKTYYLELGVVLTSPMGNKYTKNLSKKDKNKIFSASVKMQDVLDEVVKIIKNEHKNGERIKVNKTNI